MKPGLPLNRMSALATAIGRLCGSAFLLLRGKWDVYTTSARLIRKAVPLAPSPASLEAVKRELQSELNRKSLAGESLCAVSDEEQALIRQIEAETRERNRNNVTRTNAYWRLYARVPKLHWALLAHMVSRNAGWCMTDLKGELLPRLLGDADRLALFNFLETANALIFQDAYPQLRLYEESRNCGKPLFHLLGRFYVSRFMAPIWRQFWHTGDSCLLTEALVINEQHYIESRVVQNPEFRRDVLEAPWFRAQGLLQLNQVVFPYAAGTLAGLVLEQFDNLTERIGFGMKLYALLFGVPAVREGVCRFAAAYPHSGSREDAWPRLFSGLRPTGKTQAEPYLPRLEGGRLRAGAARFYSPKLPNAWHEQPLAPPDRRDWFIDASVLRWFGQARAPFPCDMTNEFAVGLAKLELAVAAKETVTRE